MENELVLEVKSAAQKLEAATTELKAAKDAVAKVSELEGTITELKSAFVKKEEADKVTEMHLKAINESLKGQKQERVQKSFSGILSEALEAKADSLNNFNDNRRDVRLELKAVGDMQSGNFTITGTESFAGSNQVGVVGRKPYEIAHVRNLIPTVATNSDQIFVIRDAAGEGAPTAVTAGSTKPQSDRDYVKLLQPVTKIAHYYRIPEEYLTDLSWLQNEIQAVGIEELLAKEDDLVLNATGSSTQFAGLTTTTNSTAFNATTAGLNGGVDLANNYDVLVAAWTQSRINKVTPNYVLMNPADYARMILTKESATNGSYVFGAPNIAIPNIFGIPIVPHTAIASDKFLMGDFTKVYLAQRAGLSVRFYDQDQDNAIKNMVTVVIEERLSVVAGRADYLIYGDFSDAKTALETA